MTEYYSFFHYQYWVSFFLFFVGAYFSFLLPGLFFLKKVTDISGITRVLLAVVLGIVLWGIQAYIFGYAGIRWATYLYLAFFSVYFFFYKREVPKTSFNKFQNLIQRNKVVSIMLSLGVIIQLIPVAGSGFLYQDGVRFFGVNSVDGVMHLAFIRSIVQHFPPVEPGATGHALTNYHYWSDLIIADFVRIWRLPITHTFFQFFPLLISFFTGIAAYKVVRVFGWPKTAGIWSLFFLYFAGDAGYLFMLLFHQKLSFSVPAIDNGATQFLNMPHAMAKMVFLTSLISLHFWMTGNKKFWGFMTIILFGALTGLKIYFAMFAIFGFCLVTSYQFLRNFFRNKKHHTVITSLRKTLSQSTMSFLLLAMLGVFSLAIYLPPNSSSGGLGYYPLEWPKIFLGTGGLNWNEWWLRKQVYEQANNYRNLIILDVAAIVITLISIHGTRLIGALPSIKMYKKLGLEKTLFFLPGVILFHFLGLYTLQESGGFNVFNFFAVSTVVLSLFSSFILTDFFFSKNMAKNVLIVGIIIFTIPRVLFETYGYTARYFTPKQHAQVINYHELNALHFLRENTDVSDIVQSHPNNSLDRSTPYVSFFSNRLTYLTGVGMQETHNQPIDERKKELSTMFAHKTEDDFVSIMRRNHIYYIYLQKVPEQHLHFSLSDRYLDVAYENDFIKILSLREAFRRE